MFKEKFIEVCSKKGVSPTSVCIAVGLSNAAYTQWSETSTPRRTTLIKICDYLHLPYDYFDETKKEPTILAYSGNKRIDSIAKEILKTDLSEDDLKLIEFILEKYKK